MENNQQSFSLFSDQLRLHTTKFSNLSINDSIWSSSGVTKRPAQERRNFDVRVGGEVKPAVGSDQKLRNFNGFSSDLGDNWKIGMGGGSIGVVPPPVNNANLAVNGGFDKGIYSSPVTFNLHSNNFNPKIGKFGNGAVKVGDDLHGKGKGGGKKNGNKNSSNNNHDNCDNNNGKNAADKRFKTLPPSESLPRNEAIGGYIFVCNNDTMHENLKRQLFGLPPRYRDSVRAITPGLPLFLYNYTTHQLHGIFEASSFGGSNIDPKAWEDKKCPGESRFPAQVRVLTRKVCEPLEEDSFRPILHHYDGPKFRLELSIPEALSLLDICEDNVA